MFCKRHPRNILTKALKIHGNSYDYSKTVYINTKTPIIIKCNTCNEEFLQKPVNHLQGRGCTCLKCGYTKTDWINVCNKANSNPLLYILKVYNDNENFIKIGITKNKLKTRFKGKLEMPYNYESLYIKYGTSDFVWNLEKLLHSKLKRYHYIPKLNFNGKNECFKLDCLDVINHLNIDKIDKSQIDYYMQKGL